jgi:zinc transporter ZupT
MQPHVRDYLYAGLLGATPVLVVIAAVVFWRASAFEGYIGALMMLTAGACTFLGARELKPTELDALLRSLLGHKTNQNGPTPGH